MKKLLVLSMFCFLFSGCYSVVLRAPAPVTILRPGSKDIPRSPGLGVIVFGGNHEGNNGVVKLIPAADQPEKGPVYVVEKKKIDGKRKKEWVRVDCFADIREISVDVFTGKSQIILQSGQSIKTGWLGFERRGNEAVNVVELWLVLPPGHYKFNQYSFLGRGPFKHAAEPRRTLSIYVSDDPAYQVYQGVFVSWIVRVWGPSLSGYGYY